MLKQITIGNRFKMFRKITGSCHAVMVSFDKATIEHIESILPNGIKLSWHNNTKKGKLVVIGPLPPNEEMMDYLQIPEGDYLVQINGELKHLTWKSFHAIYEEIPNNGGPGIRSTSEITFDFWDRIRILFGKKLHSITCIDLDCPVSIIHTQEDCYVDRFFKKKPPISLTDQSDDKARTQAPQTGKKEGKSSS